MELEVILLLLVYLSSTIIYKGRNLPRETIGKGLLWHDTRVGV